MKRQTKNNHTQTQLLINKSKKSRYNTPDSVEKVIRYIARENNKSKDDLICCGAIGATDFTDISITIQQFQAVQSFYQRKGNFGRYIDHEIYTFSKETQELFEKHPSFIADLASEMASDFYRDNFQVYYRVHRKDDGENGLHIHFATNTVNFKTLKKRHENIKNTKEREERLQKIEQAKLKQYQNSASATHCI